MKGQNSETEQEPINVPYSVIPLNVPGLEAERCLIRIERKADNG